MLLVKSNPPGLACDGPPVWVGIGCTVLWHPVCSATKQEYDLSKMEAAFPALSKPMRRLLFIMSMVLFILDILCFYSVIFTLTVKKIENTRPAKPQDPWHTTGPCLPQTQAPGLQLDATPIDGYSWHRTHYWPEHAIVGVGRRGWVGCNLQLHR